MIPACGFAVSDGIWFCHINHPVLYFFDIAEKRITFCKIIPSKYATGRAFAGGIRVTGNKVIIAPYNSQYIIIYDFKNDSFEDLEIINRGSAFRNVFLDEDILYFIPCTFNKIVKYDLNSRRIEYNDLPPDIGDAHVSDAVRYGSEIFCDCWDGGRVIIYNTKNDSWRTIFTEGDSGYNRITVKNNRVYLHEYKKDSIKCVDAVSGELYGELTASNQRLQPLELRGDNLMVNSESNGSWLLCDRDLNIIEKFDMDERIPAGSGLDYFMAYYKNEEGKVFFCDSYSIWIQDCHGDFEVIPIAFEKTTVEEIMNSVHGRVLNEDNLFTLDNFINRQICS